jgi:hypothetical protein
LEKQKKILNTLKANLLKLVTENQPYLLYIKLKEHLYQFINIKDYDINKQTEEKELLELTFKYVDLFLSKYAIRFENDISDDLISVFDPEELKTKNSEED